MNVLLGLRMVNTQLKAEKEERLRWESAELAPWRC